MNDEKLKRITVYYVPHLKLPEAVYESTKRIGYTIHEGKGGAMGYRLFYGNFTVLVPKENVLKIEVEL